MGDELALDAETMRRLGYQTVDRLVEQIADPEPGPALRRATPAEMRERIAGDPPEQGEPCEETAGPAMDLGFRPSQVRVLARMQMEPGPS